MPLIACLLNMQKPFENVACTEACTSAADVLDDMQTLHVEAW